MKEIQKVRYDGYSYVEGGVCAAKGFRANGLYSGIKENPKKKPDLCLVFSDVPCHAAGVFTQNKVQAAPVTVSKKHLKQTGGKAQAFILNSKNANACNPDGEEKSVRMCQLAAEKLGIPTEQVLIAQTGVIGQTMPIEPVEQHMDALVEGLSHKGNEKAAVAIMTTDTVKKEVAVTFAIGGKICCVGGMGKGSGMICPNMATTLNVITTDCAISSEMLQKALDAVVKVTYNCLYIDGECFDTPLVGFDEINWGAVFTMLYARGYNGMLSIESESFVWSGERGEWGLQHTIKYINQFIMPESYGK